MGTLKVRRNCKTCGQPRLFEREGCNHILHLLLTVFTVGLWSPIWLLCGISAWSKPYRCPQCGQSKWT